MNLKRLHVILPYLIAAVWLINGLFCKVMHLVPRHQLIVARILGDEYAGLLTTAIGLSEIGIAIWILSGFKSRTCAFIQIVLIAAMNIIEFFLAPDLLLFGKINALIAAVFILIVYWNEFILPRKAIIHIRS